MRKNQYRIKSTHFMCITLILVLGIIGTSYAMWSDSDLIINKISLGKLNTNLTTQFDEIAITETWTAIYKEKPVCDKDNGNNQDKDDNNNNGDNQDKDNDNNNKDNEKNQGSDNSNNNNENNNKQGNEEQEKNDSRNKDNNVIIKELVGYNKTYSSTYPINGIPFIIENDSTLPIKLKEKIILVVDGNEYPIDDMCYIEYEQYFENTSGSSNCDVIIADKIYGNIFINDIYELVNYIGESKSAYIKIILDFSQSNLFNTGWTSTEIIQIGVSKNILIIQDNNVVNENNELGEKTSVDGGASNES